VSAAALHAQLGRRILVLDGAIGTLLLQPHPPGVAAIHRAYLEAGADIISTNTFAATTYEEHLAASRLARRAANEASARAPDRPRFVAGAIGPTGERTIAAVAAIYRERMRGLIDGGVDALLVETIVDTLHARAALEAAHGGLPLMLSVAVAPGGRLVSGEPLDELLAVIRHAPPFSIGLNCGDGTGHLRRPLETLATLGASYVSCHPAAGLPDAFGDYDEPPEETAGFMREAAEGGLLNIAGGCCGTTPAYIEAIAAAVRDVPARMLGFRE
jgi:5-methyltetrahydrofolate--homocysteine methyltransferase